MIALDSSAVICLVEGIEPAHTTVSRLLNDSGRSMVSVVALAECLSKPISQGNGVDQQRYQDFFAAPEIHVRDATAPIGLLAARLRATFNLKTPDAFHLATAIADGASIFLTTDQHSFTRCIGEVGIDIQVVPRRPDPMKSPTTNP